MYFLHNQKYKYNKRWVILIKLFKNNAILANFFVLYCCQNILRKKLHTFFSITICLKNYFFIFLILYTVNYRFVTNNRNKNNLIVFCMSISPYVYPLCNWPVTTQSRKLFLSFFQQAKSRYVFAKFHSYTNLFLSPTVF